MLVPASRMECPVCTGQTCLRRKAHVTGPAPYAVPSPPKIFRHRNTRTPAPIRRHLAPPPDQTLRAAHPLRALSRTVSLVSAVGPENRQCPERIDRSGRATAIPTGTAGDRLPDPPRFENAPRDFLQG